MTELACAEARGLAPEYALGILEFELAHKMSRHISGCVACRREVDEMGALGDQLLDLIPDAEPPLGLDRAVIAAIGQRTGRRRHAPLFAGVAAVAAVLAVVIGLAVTTLTGSQGGAHQAELTAVLHQGDRPVGSVYIDGHPAWLTMSVDHVTMTGTVTCQLVSRDGSTVTVGEFQLVDGSGKWSAPDPAANSQVVGARLLAPDGTVMATATFASVRAHEAD